MMMTMTGNYSLIFVITFTATKVYFLFLMLISYLAHRMVMAQVIGSLKNNLLIRLGYASGGQIILESPIYQIFLFT